MTSGSVWSGPEMSCKSSCFSAPGSQLVKLHGEIEESHELEPGWQKWVTGSLGQAFEDCSLAPASS